MTADFLLSLAQAVTKGLLTGMVYGLMALGLSVIFGVMRVVNFAHGEMMVVGMYLAWMGFEYLGVSPLLSLPVIAVLFFFAGYALQRSLISPFIGRPEHQQFLLLLAVAILLVNASLAIAGPDSRGVQLDSQFDSYELGPLVFDAVRLHAALAAIAIAGPAVALLHSARAPASRSAPPPTTTWAPSWSASTCAGSTPSPSASAPPAWAPPARS